MSWSIPWDYDEPFVECPKCGDCANWHWAGICGNPEGRRRRRAAAAPSTSSKPRKPLSLVPGTKDTETRVA